MIDNAPPQRIDRLTPLDDVLARIDALVAPVESRERAVADAIGQVLAGDVAAGPHPRAPLALRDGWAVRADLTSDASSYAPAPLPAAARIDAGEPVPAGADAVAPLDVVAVRAGRMEIIAPVGAGEGVLQAGADADGRLLPAGGRVTRIRAAVLAAAGLERVSVREPRVRLVRNRAGGDAVIDAAMELIAGEIAAAGGRVLSGAAAGAGSPLETAAFGFVGSRPVLLLPGRLDAALAVWLVLGRRLLARLSGCGEEEPAGKARLARKVASSLGLAEVIPVRIRAGAAEPIASGYVPFSALAQADGWILVPADSEGYPPGAEVVIRPWS